MKDRVESSEFTFPRERIAEHIAILRRYASQVIGRDEPLGTREDADRATRLEDYFAMGKSFNFTHKVMVQMLFKDLWATRPGEGDEGLQEA